jgi:YVTN family beta-propeller protein
MILKIMILAPVVIVSNNAFAQRLHDQTLYEVVKQRPGLGENAQIDVGKAPLDIAVNTATNTIYVANARSNSISVISGENNTKIGEDILLGDEPTDIAVNKRTNTVYVSHRFSDTVSVISGENNTKIGEDIPVGNYPTDIAVNELLSKVYVLTGEDNDKISVIRAWNNTKIGEDISLEHNAMTIGVDDSLILTRLGIESGKEIFVPDSRDKIYVANLGSNSISVISGENNTKIGEDIPVGDVPADIAVNKDTNTIYVANLGSNSISVISGENNTKIGEDILLGDVPADIAVNQDTNTIYVADGDSDTVSVISGENNTKIGEDILVGDNPQNIAVYTGPTATNTIYVANSNSGTVSVIEATANKVVAGVTFQVNPFNSGYIVCDDPTTTSPNDLTPPSPIRQYIYVHSGTQCTAKPNPGFEFASWEENLEGNSTQLITLSRPVPIWESFASFVSNFPMDDRSIIMKSLQSNETAVKPEAKLNVTKFGTFTANFKELPPAFPPEYLIPLYGIIASTIIGWSIPSIIGWARSKRDVGKLNYFHKEIASLYGDGKLDEDDIGSLDDLTSNVKDAYSEGKINEKHYESLRNEISILYEKIFRKKIGDSLNNSNSSSATKKLRQEQLTQIRNEVENAYSEGKINEKHYDLLNKAISNLESKEE